MKIPISGLPRCNFFFSCPSCFGGRPRTKDPHVGPSALLRMTESDHVPSTIPESRHFASLRRTSTKNASFRTEHGRRPCELTDRSPLSACKAGTGITEGSNTRQRLCADILNRRPCELTDRSPQSFRRNGADKAQGGSNRNRLCADVRFLPSRNNEKPPKAG